MEAGDLQTSKFEQQFKNIEKHSLIEGDVTAVDVAPDSLSDNVPVLIGPGWSENHNTYKKTSEIGFNLGRRVISIGFKKEGKIPEGESNFAGEELRKAKLLLQVLENKGAEKVDALYHSEGAIYGLIAALMKPQQFRNIVLDTPAGLLGKDTKAALTGRFIKLLIQEAIARPTILTDPTSSLRAGGRTAMYMAENPQRVLREMDAISSTDISEMIDMLSKQNVKISVIAGVDDPLFPAKRQIAHMYETGKPPSIKGYYSVVGGHNELSIDPKRHAALAFNALDNLRDLGDRQK